jgi:hypothetical protein
MEDERDRELVTEIPPCYMSTINVDTGDITLNTQYPMGWTVLGVGAVGYETQIDLSGYAMDDLTFYFHGSYLQEAGPVIFNTGAALLVYDLVTTVPVNMGDMIQLAANSNAVGMTNFGPATAGTGNQTRETVIHSQIRWMGRDDQFPGSYLMAPRSNDFQSSLEPTAADRLYVYRVCQLLPDVAADPTAVPPTFPYGSSASLPSARIVMPGMMAREPELQYMMRLKRSYELANQQ